MSQEAPTETLSTTVQQDDIEVLSPDKQVLTLLSWKPLDSIRLLVTELSIPACGGISNFIGITRDNFNGRKVTKLAYESYPTMAMKKMMEIGVSIQGKFEGIHRVVVAHRLGEVPVSEASVIISVASEHRDSGLEAVQYGINTLKANVPIWKKELYADGHDNESVAKQEAENPDIKSKHHQHKHDCLSCNGGGTWKSNKEFVEMVAQRTAHESKEKR